MTDFDTHWRNRYGNEAATIPSPPENARAILEALLTHRTVRAYRDQSLEPGTLELLVAAAQSAASSSNLQTWSVVAVEDPARKARLADFAAAQAHIREAPLLLVWLADLARLERTGQRRGSTTDAIRYHELFLVASVDAALAAQNAVLAAETLGLGTGYIGAIRNHPEKVMAELKLPHRVFPLFGLTVGHPDPNRPTAVKPRLPQSVVLHRETYTSETESQGVSEYDELIQAFQRSQSMRTLPWSQQATQRVAGEGSISGRHRLAEAIRSKGLALE